MSDLIRDVVDDILKSQSRRGKMPSGQPSLLRPNYQRKKAEERWDRLKDGVGPLETQNLGTEFRRLCLSQECDTQAPSEGEPSEVLWRLGPAAGFWLTSPPSAVLTERARTVWGGRPAGVLTVQGVTVHHVFRIEEMVCRLGEVDVRTLGGLKEGWLWTGITGADETRIKGTLSRCGAKIAEPGRMPKDGIVLERPTSFAQTVFGSKAPGALGVLDNMDEMEGVVLVDQVMRKHGMERVRVVINDTWILARGPYEEVKAFLSAVARRRVTA